MEMENGLFHLDRYAELVRQLHQLEEEIKALKSEQFYVVMIRVVANNVTCSHCKRLVDIRIESILLTPTIGRILCDTCIKEHWIESK